MTTDSFATARQRMIEMQIRRRGISDRRVLDSMSRIPRHIFVPPDQANRSYDDCPLSIGFGQTISQPYIVAYMTEKLLLSGCEKVLEIGTGSGYQTAILAETAASVFSVEIIPELAQSARKRLLKECGFTNVRLQTSDGQDGWPEFQPYDRILLTAAPDYVPPALFEQLADDGILLAPEGAFLQKLCRYRKRQGGLEKEDLIAVSFVPLVGKK